MTIDALDPYLLFNFEVTFAEFSLAQQHETGTEPLICSAAFSEVSGLEATMEPKVIKEGGRNYGAVQRTGPVTFGTVVLKRGVTRQRDLFRWFKLVSGGDYARRLNVYIQVRAPERGQTLFVWKLHQALPIKFKGADLSAAATSVAIEELHLAHEGLELVQEPERDDAARPVGDFPPPSRVENLA